MLAAVGVAHDRGEDAGAVIRRAPALKVALREQVELTERQTPEIGIRESEVVPSDAPELPPVDALCSGASIGRGSAG